MSDERIDWYGGGLGRANKDQVSIERNGNIAIGYDLLAEWGQMPRARIGFVRAVGAIVVQPTAERGAGNLAVQMPRTDRRAARIAAACALKSFGLPVDKLLVCRGEWRSGRLWIAIGKPAERTEPPAPPRDDDVDPMAAEIEAEDALKPADPDNADLIGMAEVCRLAGLAARTVAYFRKQKTFPEPVSKRGPANLWRRGDIAAWLAQRTTPPAAADADLLDTRAVAALCGCTQTTLYVRISRGEFPRHTHARGKAHCWTKAAVEQWLAARRTPAPQPARTCASCADHKRVGRIGMCRSDSSAHRNQAIEPSGTCASHRRPSDYRPRRMDDED